MDGVLDIVSELRHFIQILANQPCIIEAIAELGDNVHSICKTWDCLRSAMLVSGKSICGDEAFQVNNENDVIIPQTPMQKYVMSLILQAMLCEVVEPRTNNESADIIDFRTKKRI